MFTFRDNDSVEPDKTCRKINDAIPSTSTGQNSIRTEENQWFQSWEALNEFKQDHDAAILLDIDTNPHDYAPNPTQLQMSKENHTECDTLSLPSKSYAKPRGRPPGKKKMSILEKKQKEAERKKKAR